MPCRSREQKLNRLQTTTSHHLIAFDIPQHLQLSVSTHTSCNIPVVLEALRLCAWPLPNLVPCTDSSCCPSSDCNSSLLSSPEEPIILSQAPAHAAPCIVNQSHCPDSGPTPHREAVQPFEGSRLSTSVGFLPTLLHLVGLCPYWRMALHTDRADYGSRTAKLAQQLQGIKADL